MYLHDFIRTTQNAALAGGIGYVFGPDLLLHYWPALRVPEACALGGYVWDGWRLFQR
jgi:hypothetical protein